MSKSTDYSAISKIKFTDEDMATAMAWSREGNPTKTVATLDLDNAWNQRVNGDALAAFAKLADALGYPVSKSYGGLEIIRPYTMGEIRNAALDSLKYGYSERTRELRDKRAAEQDISPYKEDD